MADTEFSDVTGGNFTRSPLAAGTVRAIYVTGSGSVPENAAEIAEAKAAGVGLILIDQSPSLSVFAAGNADVADIENLAGTDASAHAAVAERQARGLPSVLYVSQDSWAPLKGALASPAGVSYWVANYGDSEATAETFIAANADVVAVQFGDPASNPGTDVPGTGVPLSQAQADIDVARTSWLAGFLPGSSPQPVPPVPAPSTWQEDMMRQLPTLSQGATGQDVRTIQALCTARGHTATVDGAFGPLTRTAVEAVQAAAHIGVDGIVGPQTWPALMDV